MSWYRFAVEYVDARWPQLGGNSRKNMAKTLTATTIALLRTRPTQFAPAAVRTALREWAFNTNRRPDAPRDVVATRVEDVTLPRPDTEDQWCELLIHTATPEVGKQWTDTGEIRERRDLKGRAEGETRTVPGHPALTRILRQHVQDERLKPGDLLFQGESGGILAGAVIRRAWRGTRKAVLPPHVFESPTGRRVYDNRHTRLTKWRSGPGTAWLCCSPHTLGASTDSRRT